MSDKTISGITDSEIQPFYAVELLFSSGAVRLWTGYDDKNIEGNTYVGAGNLLSIPNVEEIADMSAKSADVVLSGVSTSLVSLALQEPYQGRNARILFGIEGQTPIEVFGGLMDVMTINDSGEASTISLTLESRLVELERIRPFRYTDNNHKLRHPTDDFFSFVPALQDREILWGREVVKPT
tara:strand:+ start:1548 stop:2093 length:546 start_codon:yes stop_codon:yes gene_type:complete